MSGVMGYDEVPCFDAAGRVRRLRVRTTRDGDVVLVFPPGGTAAIIRGFGYSLVSILDRVSWWPAMNLASMPERKEYSCTVCGHAMTPSEAWVIWLPHEDCRYRCEQHRENGQRVKTR